MKIIARSILILTPVMLIAGCASIGGGDDVDTGPTLADLEPAIMPEKSSSLPQVDLDTLITVYKDVLEVTEEPGLQIQVLQRLAGLEMKRGEQKLTEQQGSGQFDLAIEAYKRLLESAPDAEKSDRLRYQLSKAYDLSGQVDKSMAVLNEAVAKNPDSIHYGEAQFRRAEIFFSKPDYRNAELAYAEVIALGDSGPYYKNALYMHGWSQFKQQRYLPSLRSFISVLDLNIPKDNNLETLSRGERELTLDVLRVMGVVFSYLEGPDTIAQVFDDLGERHYMPLMYEQLGKLYLKKERYRDSAETYRAFVTRYPQSDLSPVFYGGLIDAYIAGAFSEEVLQEKEKYIGNYGIRSQFWQQKSTESRDFIRPSLKQYLPELARHYHAMAQKNAQLASGGGKAKKLKKNQQEQLQQTIKASYLKAGDYYQEFIDTFPADEQVPEIYYLLAETRFGAGQLMAAIEAYETVAYKYTNHKRGTESGYSAIVAYARLLDQLDPKKPEDKAQYDNWLRLKIDSQLRFANTFSNDERGVTVLAKSAEELLQLTEYQQAIEAAQLLVNRQPPASKPLRKTAWLVIGLSQFELGQYDQSEIAYRQTLALLPAKDPSRASILDRLAASVYKQGEQTMLAGNQLQAADQFLRVAAAAPGSAIGITAQFDAANAYMATSSWQKAIEVLTRFRTQYPDNKLSSDIPAKLVVAYESSGQWSKAARELTNIYNGATDEAVKRESLYQAAELYEKSGDISSAIKRYRSYAHAYPEPFAIAMEARFKLSELYLGRKEEDKRRFWLKKMISADATAGKKRSDRSRYLAAFSATVFAEDDYRAFESIPLKLPLKKSLKRKKKALNKALASYKSVTEYGVQEFGTQATFRIASIYQRLSSDLMDSERPKGLDELAMEEYTLLLEEQAFPFEEKSIAIHETNTQRSWQGTYDDWIQQSFSSLKTLLPARYGKDEGGVTFDNEIY